MAIVSGKTLRDDEVFVAQMCRSGGQRTTDLVDIVHEWSEEIESLKINGVLQWTRPLAGSPIRPCRLVVTEAGIVEARDA